MSKLTVVTGAAGFIGSNVVATLNQRGNDQLLLVDALGTDDKWKNLLGTRYEDLISPAEYLAQIQSGKAAIPDAIIHLGACSATTERDADYLLRNNYQYTRTLCEWSLQHGVRFVYASSAATYGDGAQGYSDEDAATPGYRPLNMYGYSKHLFDLWALKATVLPKIVGLKYFNVYGPHEDYKGDMRSVIHKAHGQIKQTGVVQLFKSCKPGYADGAQQRDFIYVKDVVDVTLHFVEQRHIGGLFNCGTGAARTWKDLVSATFRAMGKEPNIEFIDMPPTLRQKYQYFTQAQTAKLRSQGQYQAAFTSLEAGITDYVRNYLELAT